MPKPPHLRTPRRFILAKARRILYLMQHGSREEREVLNPAATEDDWKRAFTIAEIAKLPGMPGELTIYRWAEMFPSPFGIEFHAIRNAIIDRGLEETVTIADLPLTAEAKNQMAEVKHRQLRVETRQKNAALLRPDKYGPKVIPTQIDQSIVFQTVNYFTDQKPDALALEVAPS